MVGTRNGSPRRTASLAYLLGVIILLFFSSSQHAFLMSAMNTTSEYLIWRTQKRRANAATGDEIEQYLNELLTSSLDRPAVEWRLD